MAALVLDFPGTCLPGTARAIPGSLRATRAKDPPRDFARCLESRARTGHRRSCGGSSRPPSELPAWVRSRSPLPQTVRINASNGPTIGLRERSGDGRSELSHRDCPDPCSTGSLRIWGGKSLPKTRPLLPTLGMWDTRTESFLIRLTPALATPMTPPAEDRNMTGEIDRVNPEHKTGTLAPALDHIRLAHTIDSAYNLA